MLHKYIEDRWKIKTKYNVLLVLQIYMIALDASDIYILIKK